MKEGVSQQRMQQICKITKRYVNEPHLRPYAPSIDRAIGLIEEALPMRRSKIEKLLVGAKLIHRNGNFASIKTIAVMLGRSLNAESLDKSEDSYVLSSRQLYFIKQFKKNAISAAAKQTPISALSLASKFKSEFGKPIPNDLLEEALRSIKSHCWFEDKSGWYGLRNRQHQLLELRIKKTLRFCQKISIKRLREALLRDSVHRHQILKIEVLSLVCRMIPTAKIKNGVLSINIKDDLDILFQSAELQIVKFLMSNNAKADIYALKSHAEKFRIHKATLWSVLMSSSVIERVGSGQYGLIR